MSDTNKKSMQKSTVQKKMVNESIASYGEAERKNAEVLSQLWEV